MLATVVFGMVASRWLSKHDYATIKQTFLAYNFAAPLLMLGLPNALYYFLPREHEMKRGVIIDNMALLTMGGFVFSLFIVFGGHQLLAARFDNPDLRQTLSWLFLYPLIIMPIAGLAAVLVCSNRARTLAVYNVVSNLVLTLSGIVAILLTKSYTMPIIVRIVVPVAFLPIAVVLMFSTIPGRFRWPKFSSMKEMVRYSVPLGLATMLGSITLQLHSIIVASFCSPEEFVIYINGAMEIPLIGIVTGSITMVIFAEMTEMCHKGEKKAALELFHKASLKSACILLPTMCYLLVVAEPFIVSLYSEQYLDSVVPFTIYLFVLPVRIVVYGAALMALGMTRIILIRSFFDLLINGLLCILLVHFVGYNGAALATILTLYIWTIPFNIKKISTGMGVTWYQCIPFEKLFHILLISVFGITFAIFVILFTELSSIFKIFYTAILYWPIVGYMLYRNKYFNPPRIIEKIIPTQLRV